LTKITISKIAQKV